LGLSNEKGLPRDAGDGGSDGSAMEGKGKTCSAEIDNDGNGLIDSLDPDSFRCKGY
jgi:hypothetical protein